MATTCFRRPTLTATRVSTSYSPSATYRNEVHTSSARTSYIPYVVSSCVTRSTSRVCRGYTSTRYSIYPGRSYTTRVPYNTQRPVYVTTRATYYSTSCTVTRRPTPTPPRPITSYITIGTTTTQTSVFYPSQTTVDGPSIVDGSTIIDAPSDFPIVDVGVPAPKKIPIGAIIGGILGGLVVAVFLGLLVYFLVFRKSKRYARENSREHLGQRPLSEGYSSPSDGSSGVVPQMQEYGIRNSYISTGQGHQYAHVRQDSVGMALPVPGPPVEQISPVSSPGLGTEQGHYYPRGQYVGHAEIQDSRF